MGRDKNWGRHALTYGAMALGATAGYFLGEKVADYFLEDSSRLDSVVEVGGSILLSAMGYLLSNRALGHVERVAREGYKPRGAEVKEDHMVIMSHNHTATRLPDNGDGTYGDVGEGRAKRLRSLHGGRRLEQTID